MSFLAKNKGFVVLGGLTVLAVGYAVFDFQSEKKQTEVKEKAAILVPWEASSIQEVEITSTDNQNKPIKLQREKDSWKLIEPISDLADQNEVNDLVEGITKEKSVETIQESNGIDWKIFGLEEPRGRIRLKKSSGEEMILLISSKKNFQGDAFMRKDKDDFVTSVSSSWFSKLEKKAEDFRDKKLLRQSTAELQKLEFRGDQGQFTLILKDGKWQSEQQPHWGLDQNKVREIVQALGGSLVSQYVQEKAVLSEVAAADLKKYGLEKARLTITASLKAATESVWKARIGQDKDKIHYMLAEDSGLGDPPRRPRVALAEVTSVEAEKFLSLTIGQLRNRSEPFDFPKQDVKKIELRTTQNNSELEMKGETWEVLAKASAPAAGTQKIELSKVEGLLSKLKELQVTEFIDKKMNLPGTGPSVFLKDAGGKSLFELQLGELQKKKIDGVEKSVYVAKTNLIPDLITIEESAVKSLELDAILTPPLEANPASAAGDKK